MLKYFVENEAFFPNATKKALVRFEPKTFDYGRHRNDYPNHHSDAVNFLGIISKQGYNLNIIDQPWHSFVSRSFVISRFAF